VGIRCADHTTPYIRSGTNFAYKRRSLGLSKLKPRSFLYSPNYAYHMLRQRWREKIHIRPAKSELLQAFLTCSNDTSICTGTPPDRKEQRIRSNQKISNFSNEKRKPSGPFLFSFRCFIDEKLTPQVSLREGRLN
jgi:hypothetical protein